MKVFVDAEKCQGHLRCALLVPEVFEPDDMGHAVPRDELVPPGLEDRIEQAVDNCPEQAIRIER